MSSHLLPAPRKAALPAAPARAAPRTQLERRQESDRRMLRALTRLISRHGVAGTSLADVGVAAGYSRGLPVERFGSKLGMIEALLESMNAWFERSLVRALEGKVGLGALTARLEAHLEGARRSPEATAALYAIYVESLCVMPELRPAVTAHTGRWRAGMVQDLREAQRRGEVRAGVDCERHAAILLGAMRGLLIQHLMDDASTGLAAVRAAVLSLLQETLAAPAASRAGRRARRV